MNEKKEKRKKERRIKEEWKVIERFDLDLSIPKGGAGAFTICSKYQLHPETSVHLIIPINRPRVHLPQTLKLQPYRRDWANQINVGGGHVDGLISALQLSSRNTSNASPPPRDYYYNRLSVRCSFVIVTLHVKALN